MNGMLGFLENSTGRHLEQTIEALRIIGVPQTSGLLGAVSSCMTRHGVTWERLRDDLEGTKEFQVTSFRELHGEALREFSNEVSAISRGFELFHARDSGEDAYDALRNYLEKFEPYFNAKLTAGYK